VIPEASWFPIVCEVKNDGPTFTALIEVSAGQFNESQTRWVSVELPTGTLKRLVIPAFSSSRYRSSWDVRLLNERHRVIAEQANLQPQQNKQVAAGVTLLGSISRTPNGAPALRQTRSPDLQPRTARIQTAIFPDNPLVLEGMDSLYINSEKAPDLTVGQVNALLAWLHAGGHLILAVEQISDVNGTPWLKSLAPCDLTGMTTVTSHGSLQEWVRSGADAAKSRVRLQNRGAGPNVNPFSDLVEDPEFEKNALQVATGSMRGGRVEVSAGDTPLFVTSHVGEGRVTVLLFSPEREPMRSWKNLPSFWARMAEVAPELYATDNNYFRGGYSIDGVFGAMIDSKQIRKLPVEWLLLLLIVYLVVIGPLDQYWLKRIRKPMLTWITFPCYVVMFSLLIYFIGYKLRAGETEWNELHVVDVLETGDGAELRGRSYASIYSPVNATYNVQGQQHYSTFRGEFQSSWNGGGQGNERANVYQVGDNFKAEIFVPVWTSQLFVNDWWEPAALPFSFTVAADGGNWVVTVKNQRDKALANGHIVIGDRIYELGELPAEQSKAFKIGKEQGQALGDFVRTYASRFQQASQQRMQAFGAMGGGRLADLPNTSMAVSFVSHFNQGQGGNADFVAPPGLDLSQVADRGSAILLAWEPDYAPTKSINQFSTRRGSKNTLWRMSVPINPASAP
jgi:hypothetical protein